MLESSQLQILIAVENSQNLSQAAESINITQSAVSQSLKSIEKAKLGFPVVSRQGKKVALTPAGKKLAKLGKTYIKRIEDLVGELQQEKQKLMGSVNLGTMYGIGKSWMASRMIEFSSHFPDLSVKVAMEFPEKLLHGFDEREFDCLILPKSLMPAHADYKLLHTETSTLVFPDHPDFNITTETTLKEIQELMMIFFEEKDPCFTAGVAKSMEVYLEM